jgi:HNH endonuclease
MEKSKFKVKSMFMQNKYTNWYFSIIEKAVGSCRTKDNSSYVERHHIIPKSLGGSEKKDNLVLLTFREHFVCHHLLTRMVSDTQQKVKMNFALFSMTLKNQHHQRELLLVKRLLAFEANRQASHNRDRNPFEGRKHKEESKRKTSKALQGRKMPADQVEKICLNNIKTNGSRAEKVRKYQIGRPKTTEHRAALATSTKLAWKRRKMVLPP